jgi:glycosyltransferase involved in cell wall biosynthesis
LTVIIPCYNEEAVLPETIRKLSETLDGLIAEGLAARESNLLFVDDGSADRTWTLIREAHGRNPRVAGLRLSRNAGHQKALLAGLQAAHGRADCVVSIDADLQDDVGVMREFLLKYLEGFDIVYGVRKNRASDSWFKRTSADVFYRFTNRIGIGLIPHHADYRLLSARALAELVRYRESNLFLRGIVPLIGFPSAVVLYDRRERAAGESKYPLRRMLAFAFDGITSFSVAPIRWVTMAGFGILLVSLLAGLYVLTLKWLGRTVAGWASLMLSLWMLGGLQLTGIGLIGEYIGKMFVEVKRRPPYAVETDLYTPARPRRGAATRAGEGQSRPESAAVKTPRGSGTRTQVDVAGMEPAAAGPMQAKP